VLGSDAVYTVINFINSYNILGISKCKVIFRFLDLDVHVTCVALINVRAMLETLPGIRKDFLPIPATETDLQ